MIWRLITISQGKNKTKDLAKELYFLFPYIHFWSKKIYTAEGSKHKQALMDKLYSYKQMDEEMSEICAYVTVGYV